MLPFKLVQSFRGEERNKHVRGLAARQAPSLKKYGGGGGGGGGGWGGGQNYYYEGSRNFYFPTVHKKLPNEDTIFSQTLRTYCLFISKKAPQQVGGGGGRGACFVNSEMQTKIHSCPSINKSTDRHPSVQHYQSAILSTIVACVIT